MRHRRLHAQADCADEFRQRVDALIDTRRQRRSTGGLHETTGLALRARTMREIEALLRTIAGRPCCVVVMRPVEKPYGAEKEAGVVRRVRASRGLPEPQEVRRTARRRCGGRCAWRPRTGRVGAAHRASSTKRRPVRRCGAQAWPRWTRSAPQTPRQLVDSAEAACLAARETGVPARLWDPDDFDVAPDVIVVEDDDALAEMEVFALESRGLSWRRFATGPSALAALVRMRAHGRRPIVLLDVDLPGLDGHSLHERLRDRTAERVRRRVRLGASSEAEQLRALQAGALDYITKPVRMRVLMAKIDSWRARVASA